MTVYSGQNVPLFFQGNFPSNCANCSKKLRGGGEVSSFLMNLERKVKPNLWFLPTPSYAQLAKNDLALLTKLPFVLCFYFPPSGRTLKSFEYFPAKSPNSFYTRPEIRYVQENGEHLSSVFVAFQTTCNTINFSSFSCVPGQVFYTFLNT